jgi:hypothetical protein
MKELSAKIEDVDERFGEIAILEDQCKDLIAKHDQIFNENNR